MEFLIKLATLLQSLTKKQRQEYLVVMLGSVCFIIGGLSYWIYQQSNNLIAEIKNIEKQAKKSIHILAESNRIQQTERNVRVLLEQHKISSLNSFFETFCKEQALNPESVQPAKTEESNERYEETVLPVTFKGQTTESIVNILTALDKNNMIYLKELAIKNEGSKKVSLEITLATKNLKQSTE